MRNYALGLLLLTDLVIYLTRGLSISSASLSILLTLVVVVLVAFASSALLRNRKSLKMTKNYTYSGLIGVIVGIFFYMWVGSNIEALSRWFAENGVTMMLVLNVICAITIFLVPKPKKQGEVQEATS